MPDKSSKAFSFGGQALIEGVMMRSPHFVGAAVRLPNGEIETRLEPFHSIIRKHPILNFPIVRGVVGLFEMLGLGMKYLQWSSNIALQSAGGSRQEAGNGADASTPVSAPNVQASSLPETQTADCNAPPALPIWAFLVTVAGSMGIGVLFFVALPNLLTDWALRPHTKNIIALNAFEGAAKLLIFIFYVWLIGRKPDIRRVFEYHGAEHKVVYAAEQNLPITPESARPFDTPHPRCGTGFALLTVFVSIVCFAFLPWPEEHWKRVGERLLLMPIVAGFSYEIIKLTLNPTFSGVAKFIMIPGMWLQRLTTRQPDDAQLEVSCAAMRAVIEAEQKIER